MLAPPCVPVWDGDKPWKNQGGKTVTSQRRRHGAGRHRATRSPIVYYQFGPQDLGGALQSFGVMDPPNVAAKLAQQMVEAGNNTFELYGRKVVLKPFQATGDGKSPGPARADAIKVAKEIKAFASIGGPTQTAAYQDELARQGVLCIACGYATPDCPVPEGRPVRVEPAAHRRPDRLRRARLRHREPVRQARRPRRRPRDAEAQAGVRRRALRAGPAGLRRAPEGGDREVRQGRLRGEDHPHATCSTSTRSTARPRRSSAS